jgi:hypothetical protein
MRSRLDPRVHCSLWGTVPMRKLGEGGRSNGLGHTGDNELKKPEKTSAQFWRSPEAVFFITATLTVFCFLSHFLYLSFVEPAQSSILAKEKVFAYSSVPLSIGLVFLVAAIVSFRKIKYYSSLQVLVLIVVIVFGSFIIHGLIVFHTYLLRTLYGIYGLLP